ncbi:hypothetical protein [Streptoalloteichus hindustanus]
MSEPTGRSHRLRPGQISTPSRRSPFLPHTDNVRGFVLDVTTGSLTEVL